MATESEIINDVYDSTSHALKTTGAGGGGASNVQGPAADNAAASGNPVRNGGVYNSATQTYTSGDIADLQMDVNGNLKVREQYAPQAEDNTNNVYGVITKPVLASTYSPTAVTSFGSSTAISAKASPGLVRWLTCSNENAAVRYIQVHNKASAPATNDVPIFSLPIPAGTANAPGQWVLESAEIAKYYLTTGVAFGISTAKGTYQAATASEHTLNALVW